MSEQWLLAYETIVWFAGDSNSMMVAIFVSMVLALGAASWGPRWFALTALLVCLALSIGEFVYEIDSPVDGFRLPWLQAERHNETINGGRPV